MKYGDFVYYVMVELEGGALEHAPGFGPAKCYSTRESAMKAAEKAGIQNVYILEWEVD